MKGIKVLLFAALCLALTACGAPKDGAASEATRSEAASSASVEEKTEEAAGESAKEAAAETDFEVAEVEEGVEITKYVGEGGTVVIPETIGGKPVVRLASGLFRSMTTIDEVVMPDTVTAIGDNLFSASSISAVTLSKNLKVLSDRAFFGVKRISTIVLPEGLEEIGSGALTSMSSLNEVVVPATVVKISAQTLAFCPSDLVVKGAAGSAIESYCKDNGLTFEAQ